MVKSITGRVPCSEAISDLKLNEAVSLEWNAAFLELGVELDVT